MGKTRTAAASAPDLRKYAWLAIATAAVTVLLKGSAWVLTGSVGLLSDAAESMVNLVAAVAALVALTIAARPADHNHHFGHSKAEYFSAALEGVMVFVAAASIIYLGIERLINPRPLESIGIGMVISLRRHRGRIRPQGIAATAATGRQRQCHRRRKHGTPCGPRFRHSFPSTGHRLLPPGSSDVHTYTATCGRTVCPGSQIHAECAGPIIKGFRPLLPGRAFL